MDPRGESKASVPLQSGYTGDDAGGQTAAVQKLRRETQSKASVLLWFGHTGDDAGRQTAAVQKLRHETQIKMSKDPKGPQRS